MKAKAAHSHGWLVGVVGFAVGITLMVGFPKLKAVAGVVLLVALFHLVGIAVVLGSVYSFAPERFGSFLERRRKRTDFASLPLVDFLSSDHGLVLDAGWRKLAAEVGFSIKDEGTFNGMWFAVLERPR